MPPPASEACEREAIHLVERVQPFGVLLALGDIGDRVLRASANAPALFGREVLNEELPSLLERREAGGLDGLWAALPPSQRRSCQLWPRGGPSAGPLDAIVHQHAGMRLVELELPTAPAALQSRELQGSELQDSELQGALGAALDALQQAPDCAALCAAAVAQVARLSGYQRVMAYRFAADWCGEVVAEVRQEPASSYLGQHFPASDIPAQAREVFLHNWLRIIPDAAAASVPIEHLAGTDSGGPLDLSRSLLRAVSGVHTEYLANMGVAASMTLSLQHDGQLWGLIACHHLTPRHLPAPVRQACEIVGRMAAAQLAARARSDAERAASRRLAVNRQLAAQMAAGTDLAEDLLKREVNLLDLIEADGAAAYLHGNRWALMGRVPPLAEIRRLVQWLAHAQGHTDVYACAGLAAVYPPAEALQEVAAGVLAIAIPKGEPHYVLWFRREIVQVKTWAGDPRKPADPEAGALHPRASFARWQQTVRHRAPPWTAADVRAATALREAIIEADLSRQVEHEQRARADSEGQRSRFAFLAEASAELAGSLQDQQALQSFAGLVTRRFCDWMALYLPDGEPGAAPGRMRRHLVWHRTAEGQRVAGALQQLPGLCDSRRPQLRGLFERPGAPLCVAKVGQRWLLDHAPSRAYAQFVRDELGMQSLLLVPMVIRGRFLGVLKLVRAQLLHRFDDADVALAVTLARQLGQSRDNALLYGASQRAIRARDYVVGAVSHDLKTPLGAIQLNVDGLRRRLRRAPTAPAGEGPGASLGQAIDRIGGAAGRMRRLIDDILNVTQVEAGTLPVTLDTVSTAQILRDTLDLLLPLAEDHGVALRSAPPPAVAAKVRCDSDRIVQVLTNLVGNALKFTPRAGCVTLEVAEAAAEVRFCVRDNGPGIAPEALPHVFDRFWQARDTARLGSGLGLAIAKGIVEAHRGRIWVESELHHGAAFYFALPRQPGGASAPPPRP